MTQDSDLDLEQLSLTKPPAFQFYVQDWITGTLTLSCGARGFYISLLAYQWDTGGVPADDMGQLARVACCEQSDAAIFWPQIASKFKRFDDGLWRNLKLKKQWTALIKLRKWSSEKGRLGGRRKNRSFDSALKKHKPNESSSIFDLHLLSTYPLNPPSSKGDVSRISRRKPTQHERARAELLRRSWGGCRHDPRCPTQAYCLGRMIEDERIAMAYGQCAALENRRAAKAES